MVYDHICRTNHHKEIDMTNANTDAPICPCCEEPNTGEWVEVDCGHEEVCEACDASTSVNPTGCPWDDFEVNTCAACAEDIDWKYVNRRASSYALGGAYT